MENDKQLKVAIQGYEGCFHQIAAYGFFGKNIKIIPCATFRQVAKKVESKEADFGVMAIENSIAGSILPNFSILQNSSLSIVGELFLRIKQYLMVNRGVQIQDIKEVHSHPIALLQCIEFLDEFKWKLVETEDTALSAMLLSQSKDRTRASVAGELAAKIFGLDIVAHEINTIKNNFTRFLILEKTDGIKEIEGANKISLYFKLKHEHGSLLSVLKEIENYNLNMSKLQSYPIPSEPWHYLFYVDIEFDDINKAKEALEKIKAKTQELRICGIYKQGITLEQ